MTSIELAVRLLQSGEPIVAPTDTVYGLFADAKNDEAIKQIYSIKGRPLCNPLIAHVSSLEMAETLAYFNDDARKLVQHFWFGVQRPLTIVLPSKPSNGVSKYVTAGLDTIALRCPSHPIALELISSFGSSLAAPSANSSNNLSPTSADMVHADLGYKVKMIIDGGACSVGVESTIINLSAEPYVLLRSGGVIVTEIEHILNKRIETQIHTNKILAPGMMLKHYSPHLPLRINVTKPLNDEAFLAFGNVDIPFFLNLSPSGNLEEAAKNLFEYQYRADCSGLFKGIAIMPIPNTGIGIAINDRLRRAAIH